MIIMVIEKTSYLVNKIKNIVVASKFHSNLAGLIYIILINL